MRPTIEDALKAFPEGKVTKGSGKSGTTAATRFTHPLFRACESPIYHGVTQFYKPNGTLFMDVINPSSIEDLIAIVTN